MQTTKVVISIPDERAYDVRIGEQVIDDLGEACRGIERIATASQLLIITDDNVAPLYLARARASLKRAGYVVSDIVIPAGEGAKSLEVAGEVWEAMAALGLGRDAAVIALGGGVVGDLAGFTASTYMRGIDVVQVPTTLLSMVDSSVGGKTGVNLEAGKNLVGTFAQPTYVCASVDTLTSLDQREWCCGCAEIAKSAAIDSDDFFFWLMEQAPQLAARNAEITSDAICRSVVFKADVVARDKTESCGVRECLNYGHTLAHAIESLAGYGTYSHGAAVAEGMRFAALLGEQVIGTSAEFAHAQAALLDELGLFRLEWSAPPAEILESMKHDKKARGGRLRFVLMHDVGRWEIVEVDDEQVLGALKEFYR